MSVAKDKIFEEMEKAGEEIVGECDWCSAPITGDRLNEMPWESGESVWMMCLECEDKYRDDGPHEGEPE